MEGDLALGVEHAVQCTDDVLQECTSETYLILSTNVDKKFNKKGNLC